MSDTIKKSVGKVEDVIVNLIARDIAIARNAGARNKANTNLRELLKKKRNIDGETGNSPTAKAREMLKKGNIVGGTENSLTAETREMLKKNIDAIARNSPTAKARVLLIKSYIDATEKKPK